MGLSIDEAISRLEMYREMAEEIEMGCEYDLELHDICIEALKEKKDREKQIKTISGTEQDVESRTSALTKKQREEIERFTRGRRSVMELHQAQAVVQAILDNHDMLEKLFKFISDGKRYANF